MNLQPSTPPVTISMPVGSPLYFEALFTKVPRSLKSKDAFPIFPDVYPSFSVLRYVSKRSCQSDNSIMLYPSSLLDLLKSLHAVPEYVIVITCESRSWHVVVYASFTVRSKSGWHSGRCSHVRSIPYTCVDKEAVSTCAFTIVSVL